jgi:LuxR family maltose regulon positive regulatory protein
LAAASAWAASVDPLPLTWSLAAADPRLVQVKVFLAQEGAPGHDRATQLLAELRAYCDEVPNRRLLMEVEILEALSYAQRGDDESALETLAHAVLTAEKDGWVRLFVDLGPGTERLLSQLARRGVAPHYLDRVLSAFPSNDGAPAPLRHVPAAEVIEPLSERELDVLHLLAQRYSNKEIAARLFIASSTVKRHTLNIYRKLEVSDRREAVARAAELRLVPHRPAAEYASSDGARRTQLAIEPGEEPVTTVSAPARR